jgi:hypothetical protein
MRKRIPECGRPVPLCRPYSVLLPAGFTMPRLLPAARCALTAPFHPYFIFSLARLALHLNKAVCFLWHCPWGRPRRTLSGAVFPWSPDFPPLKTHYDLAAHSARPKQRPPGQLASQNRECSAALVKPRRKIIVRAGRLRSRKDYDATRLFHQD